MKPNRLKYWLLGYGTTLDHLGAIISNNNEDGRVRAICLTLRGLLYNGDTDGLIALAYDSGEIAKIARERAKAALLLGATLSREEERNG